MAAPWALRGLRNGVLTSRWPARRDTYFDSFVGSIEVTDVRNALGAYGIALTQRQAEDLCPTGAIDVDAGAVRLDRGRCIMCGRCVASRPDLFSRRPGSDVAGLDRRQLVVPTAPETDDGLESVRRELADRVSRLRRSVHIRHVDAGSDGSDEWEVQALLNPVYDVHRLGIFFTASPRHADILLVTGTGTAGMVAPLTRTLQGMPNPVVVIAAGADAISGGLIGPGYTSGHGVNAVVPVDVWVPGAPASPFSLLHGILLALGRLPTMSTMSTAEASR